MRSGFIVLPHSARAAVDHYISPVKPAAMSMPSAKEIARSPAGGLGIGVLVSLLLASLASAGLNTLWIARGLLLFSFGLIAAYVFLSESTAGMTTREKSAVILVIGALLLLIERAETWARPQPEISPSSTRLPVPPLMLMLRQPSDFFSEPVFTRVPNQQVALSYVSLPQGGFAGFGQNEGDDPMLAIPAVNLINLSDEPLTLSWSLSIAGEGVSLTIRGDGKGSWQRQLNRNDWAAENASRLKWRLSPAKLKPHETLPVQRLAFVVLNADESFKQLVKRDALDRRYRFTLNIRNDGSGIVTALPLPFGVPAQKTARMRALESAVRQADAES
jgi:hypothetical protein